MSKPVDIARPSNTSDGTMRLKFFLIFALIQSAKFSRARRLYDGCGVTKECFDFGQDCIEDEGCDLAVAWRQVDDDLMEFEMEAAWFVQDLAVQKWVGIGFSRGDPNMGEDTVIMTSIAFDGLYPQTRLFWSEESVKDVREVGDNSGLQDLELYEGLGGPYRKIYSSFTRMIRLEYLAPKGALPRPEKEVNDLREEAFFLQVAVGDIDLETGEPMGHYNRRYSLEPIQFVQKS